MIENTIRFVGISGSLRQASYNTKLLREAARLVPDGVTMEILSIDDIPLYNEDLDVPQVSERPAPVQYLRGRIGSADGLVIASPEYNYGIPGGLKNAIDWLSRGDDSPLKEKPIALIGASLSMMGTVRMQIDFLSIFLYLNMRPVYQPEVFIADAQKKFDEEGSLLDDKARGLIREKLEGLKGVILNSHS